MPNISMEISEEINTEMNKLCFKTGNSLESFIKASLELAVKGETRFNFGND